MFEMPCESSAEKLQTILTWNFKPYVIFKAAPIFEMSSASHMLWRFKG